MSDFNNECEVLIETVQGILNKHPEWAQRYAEYAPAILNNLNSLKNIKKKFHEKKPLHLYMNVTEAKDSMLFGVRYLGQDVAKLRVGAKKITINTTGFNERNKRDFGCDVKLKAGTEWDSKNASDFRRCFSKPIKRSEDSGKSNEEHRIESLLLSEFSKKHSEDKHICNIQPVKLAGHARFQMPTPLAASSIDKIKFSAASGGGIDILARIGAGNATSLCIIEVKDENTSQEPPTKAIQQGLAYATFIRELLRSESGSHWWQIFGFKRKLPETLDIYVVCAMPSLRNNDTTFAGTILNVGNDTFHLHYLYFHEKENKLNGIISSLPQCRIGSQCRSGIDLTEY